MIAQAYLRVWVCSNKSKSVQAERKPKACFWLCRSAADFRGEASMSTVGSLFPTFDSAKVYTILCEKMALKKAIPYYPAISRIIP